MVKMYTINKKGILQIFDFPIKDALQMFESNYYEIKFLTEEEFEECSKMDNEQRKLYYELKEDI